MLVRVTAPADALLTAADCKDHSRIDDADDDGLIARLVAAVTAHVDARDGILDRALATQTWDLRLNCFPPSIRVPLPPLQSVTSITYVDTNGDSQTLGASLYQVVGVGGFNPASIVPAYNETWPSTRLIPEAVTVRFVAGYPTEGSPASVSIPEDLRQAMRMIVADWYEQRESFQIGSVTSKVPITAEAQAVLDRYTVHYFA